jgi:hypothetical protein
MQTPLCDAAVQPLAKSTLLFTETIHRVPKAKNVT